MTDTTRVLTEQIPGPRGYTGATGATGAQGGPGVDAIVKPVTTASVLAHAAQTDPGVPGSVRAADTFTTKPFSGVFTVSQIAGQSQAIQHAGPIYPADYNLGPGIACAVGCNSSGAPVRVTDPTCVSGINYVGWCDVAGTITVAPRLAMEISVVDFGADRTGVTACDDAFDAVIAFIARFPNSTIHFPAGDYKITRTLGPFPIGCIIRGDGLSGEGIAGRPYASGTRILCYGSGVGVQLGHSNSTNTANPTILRDLEVLGALDTGFAAYPNINDVGIEILGDVGVTVQDVRTGGFRYQYSLDGAEVCKIVRPMCDGGFQGHGYQDMVTNNGDDSAIAIRVGSFKFTVPGSANSNTVTGAYFSNSRIGYYHQGGIGNSISKVAGQIAIPFWVQSGTVPLIEGYSGEAISPLCTILVRGGGLISALTVRNMQFMQRVPAILFDPTTPSTILGLDFPGNYCGQMGTWTFPIVNAAPNLIGVHCPPSTVLPTDGFSAGTLCDSFSSVQTGVLGVQLNGSEQAQAALDVILVDFVNPLLRLRSGTHNYYDMMPPASGTGKQLQSVQRVYSPSTGQVGASMGKGVGWETFAAGSTTATTGEVEIERDGAGYVKIEATAKRDLDATKMGAWEVRRKFSRSGGALAWVGAATTVFADDADGAFVAPLPTLVGNDAVAALVQAHASADCQWSVTVTVQFVGA